MLARDIILAHRHLKLPVKGDAKRIDLLTPGAPLECLADLYTPYVPQATSGEQEKDQSLLQDLRSTESWQQHACELLAAEGPDTGILPSLGDLKRHLQAVVKVVHVLVPTLHRLNHDECALWDWLDNLDTDYSNDAKTHSLPLEALRNTLLPEASESRRIAELTKTAHAPREQGQIACSLLDFLHEKEKRTTDGSTNQEEKALPSIASLARHANEMLTLLDHRLSPTGGILSLVPTPDSEAHERASKTLLGQWIAHTSSLTRRLAELEEEVCAHRDVLAGEATVPRQVLSQTLGLSATTVAMPLQPQEAWVLVDLTAGLHETIKTKLDKHEAMLRARRQRADESGFSPPESAGPGQAWYSSWVDVQSRIFRTSSSGDTFFLVPAYNLHPNTAASRAMERRALVQTVPRPLECRSETAWERLVLARVKDGESQLATVKHFAGRMADRNARLSIKVLRLEESLNMRQLNTIADDVSESPFRTRTNRGMIQTVTTVNSHYSQCLF